MIPLLCVALCLGQPDTPVSEGDVVYDQAASLKLDFVRPAGKGPFPLIVCIHGGGWRLGNKSEYRDFQQTMASKGYASAAVQYRFAPDHRFPAQRNDIQAALRFLATHAKRYHLKMDRVALMGGSAGGHLSLLVGLTPSDQYQIRAIVNVCGPTDLRTFQSAASGDATLRAGVGKSSSDLLVDLLGTHDRNSPIYTEASPITLVKPGCPAILTIHGEADDIVPISQAEALHAALKKAGCEEKLMRIPGGKHDFAQWPTIPKTTAMLHVMNFFKKQLQTE